MRVETKVSEDGYTGLISYEVVVANGNTSCMVELLDANDSMVAQLLDCSGDISVDDPHLWWPYLMHPDPGYQYTLWVSAVVDGELLDKYPVRVGIRELAWDNDSLSINHRPVYLRGVGKHEDANVSTVG